VALEGISIDIPAGTFLTMIGPSGSGKSTLLRVIAGLIAPTAGTVSVFGRSPAETLARREVGFVFQDATLLPWRSVIDNVRLPLEIRRGGQGGRFAGIAARTRGPRRTREGAAE
jgi:NitT/TauT family transport system ATP-binding protein